MKNNTHRKTQDLLDTLHADFKSIYVNMSDKDWHKQLVSYLNKVKSFSGSPTDERIVTGWIAGLCEKSYYTIAHGKNPDIRLSFEHQLKEIINSASLPKFLSRPGQVVCGKRQPSFIESIIPTLERFRVMECLPEVFGDGIDSIIVGGSMSYVPFFGIRENPKNKDFSDIDTLIVINDDFFKKTSWKKFMSDNFFPLTEKQLFLSRIKIFQELHRDNIADVFSQRFSIIGKPFTISNHFVTRSVFERMVYSDLKESLHTKRDMQYTMRDFRIDPFRHPCHARHTFDGERFESQIDGRNVRSGGFVSDMPGYIISNEKLYPGVYQTVISPALLVFYDRTGETKKLVKKFENILYKEVRRIRKNSPSATYAKAHNRYDIFPPGRYDNGYNSYLSAKEIKKYIPAPNFNFIGIESDTLPGKYTNDETNNFRNNEPVFNEARNWMEKWKNKTLKRAEIEINDFINQNNFKILFSSAKKEGRRWHTVAIIPRSKSLVKELQYRHLNKITTRKELFTQIITPSDIMRLGAYEKLAQISGKVYVASIMDSADEHKHIPISYAVVVPVR